MDEMHEKPVVRYDDGERCDDDYFLYFGFYIECKKEPTAWHMCKNGCLASSIHHLPERCSCGAEWWILDEYHAEVMEWERSEIYPMVIDKLALLKEPCRIVYADREGQFFYNKEGNRERMNSLDIMSMNRIEEGYHGVNVDSGAIKAFKKKFKKETRILKRFHWKVDVKIGIIRFWDHVLFPPSW